MGDEWMSLYRNYLFFFLPRRGGNKERCVVHLWLASCPWFYWNFCAAFQIKSTPPVCRVVACCVNTQSVSGESASPDQTISEELGVTIFNQTTNTFLSSNLVFEKQNISKYI